MPDAPTCPYCRRRPAAAEYRPFCSERCKMADLGQWLSDAYRVPAVDGPDEDGDADVVPSANEGEPTS